MTTARSSSSTLRVDRRRHAGRRRLASWALEGPGWQAARPLADLAAAAGATAATRAMVDDAHVVQPTSILWLFPVFALGGLGLRGLYRTRLGISILDGVPRVLTGLTLAVAAMVVYSAWLGDQVFAPRTVGVLLGLAVLFVGLERVALASLHRYARIRGTITKPTLIVGAGRVGMKIAHRLLTQPQYGLRPVGFLDPDPLSGGTVDGRTIPVLGDPADLDWTVQATGATHVMVAFSRGRDEELVPLLRRADELGLDISLVPRLFESLNDRFTYEAIGGLPLMSLRQTDPLGWQFAVKHGVDRLAAAAGLLVLAPLLLVLALEVRRSSPGPILFRQRRVGRDGQAFDLLKFRSMAMITADAQETAAFTPSEGSAPGGVEGVDRRTTVGRFMRRTSLDELPQLINVVRGEMSLVGPRPERPAFVARFADDVHGYTARHRVRSGITGWSQVNGLRGQTSIADRAEWDNFYIEHWSLWLDAKVLALTVLALLRPAE